MQLYVLTYDSFCVEIAGKATGTMEQGSQWDTLTKPTYSIQTRSDAT